MVLGARRPALVLLATLAAGPVAAQPLDQPAVRCQRVIGKWGSKYKVTAISASLTCYDALLRGGTCNTANRDARIASRLEKFANNVRRSCPNPQLFSAPPAGLGFPQSCVLEPFGLEPGEQACAALTVTDGDSMARCLACWKLAEVNELFKIGYPCVAAQIPQGSTLDCGTAPASCPTDPKTIACIRGFGKAAARFVITKEKALEKCLNNVLRGKIPGPCPDAKAQTFIMKGLNKLNVAELHCTGTPPWWDVCPESCSQTISSLDDIRTCLAGAAEDITDELLCLQYPSAGTHGITCPPADEG